MSTAARLVIPGVLAALILFTSSLGAAAPQQTRTVHVSVMTEDGVPVTDLTAADFRVKEGGRDREVGSAALTSEPLRLAILVADDGSGAFQQAMATLIEPLVKTAEVSIVSVVAQPEVVLDFSSDPETIVGGIHKVGPRAGAAGSGQLLEAISETIDRVAAPGKRSVIVAMRLSGGASSSLRPEPVREALRKTGTALYVFSPVGVTGGGGGGAPMAFGGAGGQARADYAAAETTYRSRNLESVVNDGSRQTGGRHVQFSGETILKAMEQLSQELMSQYQIAYTLPAGVKPSDRLEVTTTRRGVRVYAPNRIAN